jgi:hypothetical protein
VPRDPPTPMPYCSANDTAENCELADVGPSSGPKLPDLEWAPLVALPSLAEGMTWELIDLGGCSCGTTWEPMGVARLSVGSGGLEEPVAPRGLAFGEGGIASPSLGVRAPPGRPPMAGRREGGAEGSCIAGGADVGCGMVRPYSLSGILVVYEQAGAVGRPL